MQTLKIEQIKKMNLKSNILNSYGLCNAKEIEQGKSWYKRANKYGQLLSQMYGIELNKCIGVISALSPLKSWKLNKRIASDYLRTGKAGHMGALVNKCHKIMLSDGKQESISTILNGEKIKNFFLNIANFTDKDHCTIDRHALRIALNKTYKNKDIAINKAQYTFFKQAYIKAAQELNLLPNELQAITWINFRNNK